MIAFRSITLAILAPFAFLPVPSCDDKHEPVKTRDESAANGNNADHDEADKGNDNNSNLRPSSEPNNLEMDEETWNKLPDAEKKAFIKRFLARREKVLQKKKKLISIVKSLEGEIVELKAAINKLPEGPEKTKKAKELKVVEEQVKTYRRAVEKFTSKIQSDPETK
jgi:exonuclease VII small subunit